MITCSIGICVFNEEANIEFLLDSVLTQKLRNVRVKEIIIIASGSTDNTVNLVKRLAKRSKKIRLITEEKRKGKASAVNLFLSVASSEVLVLIGGDLLLKKSVIELLVGKFSNEDIGMTGARPVPLNKITDGLSGFAAHLLWDLHHRVSLKTPKMGEVIAFRKIFKRIPVLSSVDEANIEPLIRGQGYLVRYVPQAVIYNRAPDSITEFIKQRRRIYAGHLAVKNEQSYEVSTMHAGGIFRSLSAFLLDNPQPEYVLYIPTVIALEILSRVLGWYDYRVAKKRHTVWEEIKSTKRLR